MSPTPDSTLADPEQIIADLRRINAELQGELAQYRAERDEAVAREIATAEVLQVINSSPGDLAPVFDAMLEKAFRLCGADLGTFWTYHGDTFEVAAQRGAPAEHAAFLTRRRHKPGPGTIHDLLLSGEDIVHIPDLANTDAYRAGEPTRRRNVDVAGARTVVAVPLRKADRLLGFINIYRREVRPFSEKQIALLQNFAAQAVIAMENARLITETREALEQQTATAEVLQIINSSPGDLGPVFSTLIETAARLCKSDMAHLMTRDGAGYRAVASFAHSPEFDSFIRSRLFTPGRETVAGRTALEGGVVHIVDLAADPEFALPEAVNLGKLRSVLGVPLMYEGKSIGVITLSRQRVEPFTDRQIDLVRTFADQAVVAMENARLIAETREALDHQTATAEVLGVINASPGDLTPVFEAILDKAMVSCGAAFGEMHTYDGVHFHAAALRGVSEFRGRGPTDSSSGTIIARVLEGERIIHVVDLKAEEPYRLGDPQRRALVDIGGARTALAVAFRAEHALLGLLMIYRREVRPFSEQQIALLQNFAAQAVIAMENARLITETREALEQQTATAEVLQVINASPGDLAPVFDAILEKARILCGAAHGSLNLYDGKRLRAVAINTEAQELADRMRQGFSPSDFPFLKPLFDGARFVQVPDLAEVGNRYGARTGLFMPLRKDDALLGLIGTVRLETRPFSDKEIALVENFAAQAVIAIENARLITETREALEQQTATAEVLGVINCSPGDLAPVFDAILEKAHNLCGVEYGTLQLYDGEKFHIRATRGIRAGHPYALEASSPLQSLLHGAPLVEIPDVVEFHAETPNPRAEAAIAAGIRSVLFLPLRKDNLPLGLISAARKEVGRFSEKQIALLQNFAAQAVIAMENARLLGELRTRTEEVAELNRGLEARVSEQVEELGRVGRLKRFLAPQLAELIVSQGDEKILESHRREIVVVFCDLRGYTAFTETAEPEEVLDFLREYHGALGPLVSQFEGTLDQFSGDGIMVFFNDPVPIPDPAARAVKMAMAMRETAGTLIAAWRRRGRLLGFGAGIAQGYATLGQIGFADRSGYTAIGTVCNLAARLCAEAKDGQILVARRVAVAVEEITPLEEVGELTLKGLTQPVVAYNVPLVAGQPALRVIEGGPPSV